MKFEIFTVRHALVPGKSLKVQPNLTRQVNPVNRPPFLASGTNTDEKKILGIVDSESFVTDAFNEDEVGLLNGVVEALGIAFDVLTKSD